jgi:hypothetical protein
MDGRQQFHHEEAKVLKLHSDDENESLGFIKLLATTLQRRKPRRMIEDEKNFIRRSKYDFKVKEVMFYHFRALSLL